MKIPYDFSIFVDGGEAFCLDMSRRNLENDALEKVYQASKMAILGTFLHHHIWVHRNK